MCLDIVQSSSAQPSFPDVPPGPLTVSTTAAPLQPLPGASPLPDFPPSLLHIVTREIFLRWKQTVPS